MTKLWDYRLISIQELKRLRGIEEAVTSGWHGRGKLTASDWYKLSTGLTFMNSPWGPSWPPVFSALARALEAK